MFNKSLHLQLLLWLLTPLLFVVIYNAWQGYSDAELIAGIVTDRTLGGSAHAIAEQIKVSDGVVEAVIPPSALEMFASGYQDRVIYRITDSDGTLLAGYADVPDPQKLKAGFETQYFDATFRGQAIRAVALRQPVIGAGDARSAQVIVGQTLHAFHQMTKDLWVHEAWRQLVLVIIAAGLTWLGLNRGLAPLARISDEISHRTPELLEPIAIDRVVKELQPLVKAINHSEHRVRSQITVPRRFIADAAHQLRTPLTVLKAQASYGLGAPDTAEKDEALAGVRNGIDQMVHLTNQLLMLAKLEPGVLAPRRDPVDLIAVTRTVLEAVMDRALSKNINLSFDHPLTNISVLGSAAMLHEMALNIIDNALRYVPVGGFVEVRVETEQDHAVLTVQDNGPGIAAPERDRVFDRFYRILGTDSEGSGLGLPIVREIAARYSGSVTLSDTASGQGILVQVRLPRHLTASTNASV